MRTTESTRRALLGLLAGAGAAWLAWRLSDQPRPALEAPAGEAVEARRVEEIAEVPEIPETRQPAERPTARAEAPSRHSRSEPLLDFGELELEPLPEFSRRRPARAAGQGPPATRTDAASASRRPDGPSPRVGILASAERDAAGRESPVTEPLALIADDDADIRTLAAQMLERAGFEVVTAADGDEALRLAIDREPTVCVLDWMMPRRSGLDVLESLRSGAQTRSTPVLMLTARAGSSDVERGLSAGADGYLTKPFTADQLRERVLELVDLRAA